MHRYHLNDSYKTPISFSESSKANYFTIVKFSYMIHANKGMAAQYLNGSDATFNEIWLDRFDIKSFHTILNKNHNIYILYRLNPITILFRVPYFDPYNVFDMVPRGMQTCGKIIDKKRIL